MGILLILAEDLAWEFTTCPVSYTHLDVYKRQLLDKGAAYIAFDTPEELAAKRKEIPNFQYDASTRMQMRNSLSLSKDETQALLRSHSQYVVRIKIEPGIDITVDDLIRGEVTINSSVLDDKVIYKSADALPTYLSLIHI